VYYKCVKFHKNPVSGLGGVALARYMDGRTDGRTDRVIPIYVHEGILLLSKIPKFEHHSIASGGYHSVRSLTVLVKNSKRF
jgi:hypothetical protein